MAFTVRRGKIVDIEVVAERSACAGSTWRSSSERSAWVTPREAVLSPDPASPTSTSHSSTAGRNRRLQHHDAYAPAELAGGRV
jgi:hypothetical protein